jgi:hypothetical protein
MSLVQILLAAEALTNERAVRRTALRHRAVADKPLVIAAYNLSGEAAAPLGLCVGTSVRSPKLFVAPEPRNREARFGAINAFADELVKYLEPFLELSDVTHRAGKKNSYVRREATRLPQIVTPNRATRDYLGARLGRSLRYLGLGTTHPAPEKTVWAGSHLSWLAEHSHMPGQSVFLAATEVLTRHFVTGQSELENENLASLLAWIENPARSGRARIDAAEKSAWGPVPDPEWEAELEPLVRAWSTHQRAGDSKGATTVANEIETKVRAALLPAYEGTFRAIELLRAIPAAPSVERRRLADLEEWSSHAFRAQRGPPRFARRHDAVRAARSLEKWSRALEQLDFEEAMDDPMVLADVDARGECLSGPVSELDLENREVKPGNSRATQVPLVTLKLEGQHRLLRGDNVRWTADSNVHGVVRLLDAKAKSAQIAVLGGHNRGTRVPQVGDFAVFTTLATFGGPAPDNPEGIPWTHRPKAERVQEDEASPTVEEEGTPDLPTDELAERPVLGLVPPGDVPGVAS